MKKNPLLKKILFLCCLFTFSYIGGTSIRYLVNQNQVSQTGMAVRFIKRLQQAMPFVKKPLSA